MTAGQLKPVTFGSRAKYQNNLEPGSLITQDLKEVLKMCDFFDVEYWMIIGPLSEDLAEDERNQKQTEDDFNQEDEDTVVK